MFKYILMAVFLADLNLPVISSPVYVNSKETFESIKGFHQDALDYLKRVEPNDKVSRFIFIRHGQTRANAKGGLPGSRTSGDPLTEKGVTQAKQVGEDLARTKITIDRYYLSPTERTEETMLYIQRALGVKSCATQDERLHEKYHGRFEKYGSLTAAEEERLKQEYAIVKAKENKENTGPSKPFLEKFRYSFYPQEIESLSSINDRLNAFFKDTLASQEGQNILVVSHGGVLKTLLIQDAYRKGFDLDYRIFDVKNCSIVVIEIDDEGAHVKATTGIAFTPEKIEPTSMPTSQLSLKL